MVEERRNEMEKLVRGDIEKINDIETIGYPMTPGYWVGDPEYIDVFRIKMTCGGGMGGAQWYELVDNTGRTLEQFGKDLLKQEITTLLTYDGRKVMVNRAYIVKVEEATIVMRVYHSDNPNYQKGNYMVRTLLPRGRRIEFLNRY